MAKRRVRRRAETPEVRLARRIGVAETALDRALDDLSKQFRRVARLRARISRLRVAEARGAELRCLAARAGLETRRARRQTRAITVRGDA